MVSLYTYNFSAVYEIKLEWGDVEPIIYEIVLIPRNALEIDTTELARLYAKAEALDTSNASYAQREKLREAMEAAKAILDDPTTVELQAQVNQAYGRLNAIYRDILKATHTHAPLFHEAQASTCHTYGNVAYWTCETEGCAGVFYADEACTQKLDQVELPLDPNNHDGDTYKKGGTAPTCTQPGAKAYYVCECGAAFEDEAMTKPIADLDTWKVIPAKGHNFENGVCTVCGEKDPDYTEPTKPTDPSEPTNPTDPSEPTKPTDPSEPTKPTETTKPATDPEGPDQTGELASPFLLMALLLTSAACVAVMWVRLRKEKAN